MEEREREILNLFTNAIQQITSEIDKFSFRGHTLGQGIFVLNLLGNRRQCNMGDIAEFLHLPASTATRWVDKLVQGGFILRQTPNSNRRLVELSLTPKGQDAFTLFYNHRVLALRAILKDFSSKEVDIFLTILRHFVPTESGAPERA